MHAGNSVQMVFCGDASVRDVILFSVVKEGVFNLQFVRRKDMGQILTSVITSRDSIWSKHSHMFLAGVDAYPCIDVSANDDLCIRVDGVYHQIEDCTEFFMALVITREVCRDEGYCE
jgi:hypothetical protein